MKAGYYEFVQFYVLVGLGPAVVGNYCIPWKDGASRVSVCQTNIDSYLKHLVYPNWEEGVSNKDGNADDYETSELLLRSFSVFIILGLVALFRAKRVGLVKKLGCWDVRNLALQAVLVVCCYAVFMVAARQIYDLFMLASGFLVAPILFYTPVGWAAAFAVGGVVPLVLSVMPMLRRVLARCRNRGALAAETRV
ncbi:hypothetical protein K438DRAFT_1772623 [Mycena galopus ATCC 62051]|nr:hypothetical protein K438DRAFT_1772623 [Mycena galopus ATCC 62051]